MCSAIQSNLREGYIPVDHAKLCYREIGEGQPILVLHGEPDLDHTYLLSNLDRLSKSYRLPYYDQRERGKSANHIQPDLVIHRDYDFVPVECKTHIAQVIPGARIVLLQDTGHSSYIESSDEVQNEIYKLLRGG